MDAPSNPDIAARDQAQPNGQRCIATTCAAPLRAISSAGPTLLHARTEATTLLFSRVMVVIATAAKLRDAKLRRSRVPAELMSTPRAGLRPARPLLVIEESGKATFP